MYSDYNRYPHRTGAGLNGPNSGSRRCILAFPEKAEAGLIVGQADAYLTHFTVLTDAAIFKAWA